MQLVPCVPRNDTRYAVRAASVGTEKATNFGIGESCGVGRGDGTGTGGPETIDGPDKIGIKTKRGPIGLRVGIWLSTIVPGESGTEVAPLMGYTSA